MGRINNKVQLCYDVHNHSLNRVEVGRNSNRLELQLLELGPRKGIVALIDNGTMVEDTQLIFLKAHFPSAYTKLKGLPFVGTYAHGFEQDVWVSFQWDTKPQYVHPLANDGA